MLIKVNIAGLVVDPSTHSPIVILKSEDGERALPVWVGLLEASSIAASLQSVAFDRPMTHDLFKNVLTKLDMTVTSVEINDIVDNTYYARIHLKTLERNFSVDARPSDSIALALRFKAPIYVEKRVLEDFKTIDLKSEMMDKSDQGKKWAEYLEKLSTDDFGKYMV